MTTMGGLLNFVRSSQFFDQDAVNRLYQEAAELTEPIKGDIVERRIVLGQEIKERTNTLLPIAPDVLPMEERGVGIIEMNRKRPETVKSNPLTHSVVGTLDYVNAGNSARGGGVEFDGSSRIEIPHHSILAPGQQISILGWAYLPPVTAGTLRIIHKSSAYIIDLRNSSRFNFWIRRNTSWARIDVPYTTNTWFHFACTYDGLTTEVYFDGVSQDSVTGSLVNINDVGGNVGIGGRYGVSTNNLPNGSRLSHFTILSEGVDSTYVNNHMNGLLDTSDGNDEILTFPFTGTTDMLTDASSGECRST